MSSMSIVIRFFNNFMLHRIIYFIFIAYRSNLTERKKKKGPVSKFRVKKIKKLITTNTSEKRFLHFYDTLLKLNLQIKGEQIKSFKIREKKQENI